MLKTTKKLNAMNGMEARNCSINPRPIDPTKLLIHFMLMKSNDTEFALVLEARLVSRPRY